MQSSLGIPWNAEPKNGSKTFFSEDSYAKWFGRESHETKLVENLRKVGIDIKPEDLGNLTDAEPDKPAEKMIKNELDIVSNQAPVKPHKNPVRLSKKRQQALLTQSADLVHEGRRQDVPKEHLIQSTKLVHGVRSQDSPKDIQNKSANKEQDNAFVDKDNDTSVGEFESIAEDNVCKKIVAQVSTSDRKSKGLFAKNTSPTFQTSSNGKESAHNDNKKESIECHNSQDKTLNKSGEKSSTAVLDGNVPRPEAVPITEYTKPTEEKELKRLKHQNMLYFNRVDRPDKYDPLIFKNKPLHKKSDLTYKELTTYLELYAKFGHMDQSSQPSNKQNPEWNNFKRLSNIVQQEQRRYQGFLKNAAYNRCEEDYEYLHPTADRYMSAKLIGRQRRISQYPRFYKQLCKFSLPNTAAEDTPTLQYVRPLLEMGSVCRLQLPVIVSGCPQPCAPTDYKEVSSVCPPIKESAQGPNVWHHEECSQDMNAEQLAVPNKCDIVVSASCLKYLIDNQGMAGKCWSIPVTVREYSITDGDKPTSHRVVYLDKPLIRMSQYNSRDKNIMFHKYALKTAALRKKQKMITFSNICPVSEVKEAPEVSQVTKDLEKWEKILKTSEKKMIPLSSESEEESQEMDESQRRFRKRKKKPRKKFKSDDAQNGDENKDSTVRGVGVFDIEKDIDDLETFGMDSPKGFKGFKKVLSHEKSESGLKKNEFNKGYSLVSDKDLLQQEILSIKRMVQKDTAKSHDPFKEPVNIAKQSTFQNDNELELSQNLNGDENDTDFTEVSLKQTKPIEDSAKDNKSQNNQDESIVSEPNEQKDAKCHTNNAKVMTNPESKSPTTLKQNVKKTHSLSDIMQKMSTVKAKLKEREHKKDDSSHQSKETNKTPVSIDTPSSYILRTRRSAKLTESPKPDNKITADTDSDTETDGLVIDLPESIGESPKKKSKIVKDNSERKSSTSNSNDGDSAIPDKSRESTVPAKTLKCLSWDCTVSNTDHEVIESPPASPVMELSAPESPDMEAPQSPDNTAIDQDSAVPRTCVLIPLDESGTDTVVRDYSTVKNENSGNTGEIQKHSDIKTENIDKDLPEINDPNSKTIHDDLKSSSVVTRGSKRKSDEIKAVEKRMSKRVLRSKGLKEESESLEHTSGEIDDDVRQQVTTDNGQETPTQSRGRGRKRELLTERVTRSRSVSMETTSNHGNSPTRCSGRLTRRSVDSAIVEPEVPLKRKRGRPAKKPEEQTEVETIDTNTDIPASAEEPETDTNMDFKSDHEESQNNEELILPKRRGRPPKRQVEDSKEAQKVKELAQNLKTKLAKNRSLEEKDKSSEHSTNAIPENSDRSETNGRDAKMSKDKAVSKSTDVGMNQDKTEKTAAAYRSCSSTGKGEAKIGVSGNKNVTEDVDPTKTESVGSLESILNLQTEMMKPTAAPPASIVATTHDKFAYQHGMNHVKFPVEGNVTYHQWSLADTRVVVRCSFHGHAGPQGVVHVSTKMEYQPCFGYEQETNNEVARNWMSVYVRPNSSLIRTRINPFNSEIMKLEHVGFKDLIPSYSNFKPLLAFADMNTVFQRLKGLSAGQYLLRNSPCDGKMAILRSSEAEDGNFDLHKHHASFNTGGRKIQTVQWCPIDPKLLLPHHKRSRLLPLLFSLKDAKKTRNMRGGKKKRKGKKGDS